jgi:hypothetical protein
MAGSSSLGVFPETHIVQLYGHDEALLTRNVSRYLQGGFERGDWVLVIATPEHRDALASELKDLTPRAGGRDLVVFMDAQATLDSFIVDGRPDRNRFEQVVRAAIHRFPVEAGHPGLRIYGEMVGLLWKAGQYASAIQLEALWNELITAHSFTMFCAYPIAVLDDDFRSDTVDALLCAHTHLVPADLEFESALDRAMDEVLGSRVWGLKPFSKPNDRPSWARLPRAESLVLWLRKNLPDSAEEILARARQHHRSLAY